MRSLACLLLLTATSLFTFAQQKSDWSPVDKAMGRAGKAQPGDVQKYSMPRSDMHVTAAGTAVKAGLALGSWAAFAKHDG